MTCSPRVILSFAVRKHSAIAVACVVASLLQSSLVEGLQLHGFRLKIHSNSSRGDVKDETVVTIHSWYGRLGNNLEQLAHSIIYAESIGAQRLMLPEGGSKSMDELFEVPGSISIDLNEKVQTTAKCPEDELDDKDSPFFTMRCAGARRSDYRRALIKYVKPHLRPEVKVACAKEGSGYDGLTIHLRGGDLFASEQTHQQSRVPPCSWYSKVLEDTQLARLRVVAEPLEEPGEANPCLAIIQHNSSVDVSVQSGSLMEDACALMSAQHLAYGLSTFPETLALLNENLRSVAVPSLAYAHKGVDVDLGGDDDPFGSLESCTASDSKEVDGESGTEYSLYEIPGFAQLRRGSEKLSYLVETSSAEMSKAKKCKL